MFFVLATPLLGLATSIKCIHTGRVSHLQLQQSKASIEKKKHFSLSLRFAFVTVVYSTGNLMIVSLSGHV